MGVVDVDKRDRKLLSLLDFDARASLSELSSKLRMSKRGVGYKVDTLVEKGVIERFIPVVNVPKLGYTYCRLSLSIKKDRDRILDEMKQSPRWFWIFTTQGMYDVMAVMWAESITEFREEVDELLDAHGTYIEESNETIATDVIHYPHAYLADQHREDAVHIAETKKRFDIDKTDRAILRTLCKDARQSLVSMGEKVGVSSKVVSYRLKKMEDGLIETYRPVIDHKKLGLTYFKLWINTHPTKEMKEYLAEQPVLLYIVEGVGMPMGLDIEIMVESNQELYEFIMDFKAAFPGRIGDYRSVMFIETEKVRYIPF